MKTLMWIDTDSCSDISSNDAPQSQDESEETQHVIEMQLNEDDSSSDDNTSSWQVVKRKEKSKRKKTSNLRQRTSATSRKGGKNKVQKNQMKVIHGERNIPHTVQDETGEELEFSWNEECAYCHDVDTNCIVQCGNCQKWFCNTATKHGSHIIWHLAHSGHNEVILHKNFHPGIAVLKLGCFHCQQQNVFNLGFITNEAECYNILLCRLPCGVQYKFGLNDVDLSLSDWQPIIKDRYLLSWMTEKKSSQVQLQKTSVSTHQMEKLEEIWKNDPYAMFDDLELERCIETKPKRTKLRYNSAEEFAGIFTKLVQLEEDQENIENQIHVQNDTTVRWEKYHGKCGVAFVAYFIIDNLPAEVNLSFNKPLRLRYREGDPKEFWSRVGHIVKLPKHNKDEIGVQFKISKKLTECTTNFIVEHVCNSSAYTRMYNALEEFASNKESMSEYIYKSLLGKNVKSRKLDCCVPKQLSVQGLPKLNQSQEYAIKRAIRSPLCLIQGPPGTGKTVTSASLVYHLAKQGNGTVLVCAPSNVAVDNLAEKIHATGLNVVRLFSKAREDTESPVLFLGLHVCICKMDGWNDNPELVKLHRDRQLIGELSPVEEKRYNYLKWPFEKKLLSAADVICCTCVSSGDIRMNPFEFHSVLIDECTQATEPECLIPLIRGIQQAIFVGDHCQLGPVIMARPAKKAGLGTSLFERMLTLGNHLLKLQVQYRMHPALSKFSSNLFYDNLLRDGVNADNHNIQNAKLECLWPKAGTPMLFYNATAGKEELAIGGTSYLNQTEAALTEQFIAHLLSCGVRPDQIGIITPYQGQRAFLSQYLEFSTVHNRKLYQQIEVASVDVFQGREKDLIIFSCVRSNEKNDIGFLRDARRLNVAITRARYGLIVIGNSKILTKNPLWNELIIHYNKNDAFVDGPVNQLKKCKAKLNKPSKIKSFMRWKTFDAKEFFSGSV